MLLLKKIEEEWDDRSITSVEGEESDDGSIETIECNDDVLPFDIEDYDAQDGSKAYYRSLELLERQFLEFLGGGKSVIIIPIFLAICVVSNYCFV